ncbi:uncharacterized protein LTR77_008959 [Saxophila tyrrhenica]|uniref:Sexual development protein n=1 Tax=Saxophila tyrrhenica TaxID=1690608 RepID=A0AAV9NZI9_9PEZI|nr:hypothetical protein LTR77_008959 [Saxophila tyrrhenica]
MLKTLASVVLLSTSVAIAAPWGGSQQFGGKPHPPPGFFPSHGDHGKFGGHGYGSGNGSGQVPFTFPLANGFPNIKNPSPALTQIEKQAHGTLPNTPLSPTLQTGDNTIFELIAFNELFEVAFFTSLINNITQGVEGFEIGSPVVKNFVLNALITVQAQEELHALGANGILTAAGETPIQPCEYIFPSADFDSAIGFARTFTDVVLGTLQDALAGLAANGDEEYIPLIGSIIGQEGEQNGYYRSLLDLVPSELPFLTRSKAQFAFSVLNQDVVVPGSCPNSNIIDLPIFGALKVLAENIKGKDQQLEFSFTNNGTDTDSISLVYINQQNLPIVEKPTIISEKDGVVTFEAFFPFSKFIMNGLTIAVVTNDSGPFDTVDEVADATLFGPGLIEVN